MRTPSSVFAAEHREIIDAFEDFVRRELAPLAAELPPEADIVPAELHDYVRTRSARLGFYAGDYPEELGGAGMPVAAIVHLHHAAGRSGCRLAPLALTGSDGPSPILRNGDREQVKRYLEPLVRGEATRCLALTEPATGSDAFALATTARQDPATEEWVLDGRKTFVSHADRADFAIVIARVGDHGPTAFVVAKGTPGMRIGQRYVGMSGEPVFELLLDGVRLPADAVIGGVGAAMADTIDSLSRGRIMIAAMCTGIAEYALELGVEHARRRVAFGEPIGAFQHVQEHLVTSAADVETAKLLTFGSARLVDEGVTSPENAALAKLTASETAVRVVDRAMQVHGGAGWLRGHPLERLYRQVRVMTIIDGTSEIQKVIIARALGLG
ncbi:acyl-CoA dehydrogenase family protein [Amycolatopsis sp. FBCC-B4732]|uniref:acyl-CoA dehydrogenase family protein n=1 Tax=Amycolatopsis sp. FBCC-B4732 TaxID=3079339 RepID=UPI001FF4221F|nr:acyl-CoA dehydrogenase family protein [Amycolatopsis sp. FBCC-B4732]UOX90019.1 acyl-CoA dehydrogenase family protein [Amycolatopsis sp. FBCC-B4732]